jgi:lactoylglutathione lyase
VFFTDVLGFKVVGNDATYPACFLSNKKQSLNYGELRMMKNV